MKKICFITSTRAEYGSLKWLMKDVATSDAFEFQLIVTGAHLMKSQGYTIEEIDKDGIQVNMCVDADIDSTSVEMIAMSMGRLAAKIAEALSELKPDYVIVLGDRYELLAICSTAFIMRIPIIHIAGGDVTEGAIDDGVRNAVTILSEYHFPSTKNSLNNIVRIKNSKKNIWVVGALELDALNREDLMTREELAENLGLICESNWALLTYHAETLMSLDYNLQTVNNILKAVIELKGYQIVATYSNADFGGSYINDVLHEAEKQYPKMIKVVPSLGHYRYLSFLKQVKFVIGNSSSGITQTPFLRVPTINIGNRQKGRYQCSNIIQCDGLYLDIQKALKGVHMMKNYVDDAGYWGDGHAAERIMKILQEVLG